MKLWIDFLYFSELNALRYPNLAGSEKLKISETIEIQANTRLYARNSCERICKPEHRVIFNSSSKIDILIPQRNEL